MFAHFRMRSTHFIQIGFLALIVYLLLIGLLALSGILNGAAPVFHGAVFSFVLIGSLFMLVLSVSLFRQGLLQGWRGALALWAYALPLCYWFSDFAAVSPLRSQMMLYAQTVFASLFVSGMYLLRGRLDRMFRLLLLGSGAAAILLGMIHWFGVRSFSWLFWLPAQTGWFRQVRSGDGIYLLADAVMTTSDGVRLTSVFQYANTYAIFLIVIGLLASYTAVHADRRSLQFACGALSGAALLSLFLTLSRGGLIVLPVAVLLVLPLLSFARQLVWLLLLALSGLAAIAALRPVTAAGAAAVESGTYATQWGGWGWLLLAAASSGALFVGVRQLVARLVSAEENGRADSRLPRALLARLLLSRAPGSRLLLPACAVMLGAVIVFLLWAHTGLQGLLPDSIRQRVQAIDLNQHSVVERGYMYADALQIWRERPILGAGGGAWEARYEQVQDYPYTSQQVHNHFLHVLTESGLLGLAAHMLLLAGVYMGYIRRAWRERSHAPDGLFYYILATTILIHSLIDFDMSYLFIAALVFLALGGMLAGTGTEADDLRAGRTSDSRKRFWRSAMVRRGFPVVLALVAAIMLISSFRLLYAHSEYRKALSLLNRQDAEASAVFAHLNRSISLVPYHPDYTILKVDMLNRLYENTGKPPYHREAGALLERLASIRPGARVTLDMQAEWLKKDGQLSGAAAVLERAVALYPWDTSLYDSNGEVVKLGYYERLLGVYADLAQQAIAQQQSAEAIRDKAAAVVADVADKETALAAMPEFLITARQFALTPALLLHMGQIHFLNKDLALAADTLKQGLREDLSISQNRGIARWYLGVLRRQGRDDPALYKKLTDAYPEEAEQIVGIVQYPLN